MHKFYLLTIVMALSLGQAQATDAPKKEGFHQRGLEAMNLNDTQKKQIEEIYSKNKETILNLKKSMSEKRDALDKSLKAETTDIDLKQKFKDLVKVQDEFANARFEVMLSIRGLLTPEQRSKLQPHLMIKGGGQGNKKHNKRHHGRD